MALLNSASAGVSCGPRKGEMTFWHKPYAGSPYSTYGWPLGCNSGLNFWRSPLSDSMYASWRLPSTGPNMWAIRPLGVVTDYRINLNKLKNCNRYIVHLPETWDNALVCAHWKLVADWWLVEQFASQYHLWNLYARWHRCTSSLDGCRKWCLVQPNQIKAGKQVLKSTMNILKNLFNIIYYEAHTNNGKNLQY